MYVSKWSECHWPCRVKISCQYSENITDPVHWSQWERQHRHTPGREIKTRNTRKKKNIVKEKKKSENEQHRIQQISYIGRPILINDIRKSNFLNGNVGNSLLDMWANR